MAMNNKINDRHCKRIAWIDAAIFIGIFMVAYGHNWLDFKFCYYFYSFHMPLFFILAGLTFSAKNDFKSYIYKKFKTLIIPYIFFAICIVAIYAILSYTHNGNYNVFDEIKAFTIQRRHTHLWFLTVLFSSELFVFTVLSAFKYNKPPLLLSIVIFLIIIHFCMKYFEINNWVWNLDLVPLASAFIIIGYCYKTYGMKYAIEDKLWYVVILMIISISISTYNYIYNGHIDMFNNKYGSYPLFITGAIITTYILILVLKRVTLPQWMIHIGTYSLVYYGLHRIIIDLMFVIYSKTGIVFNSESILGVCLACVNVFTALLLLYPVAEFMNKKTPWLLGKF